MKNYLYPLCALWFISSSAFSQNSETAETSASFLRMGVSARALGMGGAFSAVAEGADSIYWNPAGLACDRGKGITLMHNKWVLDTSHSFFGAKAPLYSGGVGLGIIWLKLGEFEIRDGDGVLLAERFRPYDLAVITGIGLPINSKLFLGSSISYLSEKIYKDIDNAHTINLGLLYKTKNIKTGLVLKNMGGDIKGFSLPREAKVGLCYYEEGLIISGEVTLPTDSQGKVNLGTELYLSPIFLRMGYEQLLGRKELTKLGWRGGFGIKQRGVAIDYAFIGQGELGNTSCVSLSFQKE